MMHVGHEFVTRKKSRKDLAEVLANEIFAARDMDESVVNFVFEYVEMIKWNFSSKWRPLMQKNVQNQERKIRNFGRK